MIGIDNLLSIQLDSFEFFFSKNDETPDLSLKRLIQTNNTVKLDENTLIIEDFTLKKPLEIDPQKYILTNSSYTSDLWFHFNLKGPVTDNKDYRFSVRMASIPTPTKSNEFIRSSKKGNIANQYVLIMQLALAPGIYFERKQVDNHELRICRLLSAKGKRLTLRSSEGKKKSQMFKISGHNQWKQLIVLKKIIENTEIGNPVTNEISSWDFSKLGKLQMIDVLGEESLCTETTTLNPDELQTIIDRFIDDKIPETDSRSLKCRKVKLIGDFLYSHFNQTFKSFQHILKERWNFDYLPSWHRKIAGKEKEKAESQDKHIPDSVTSEMVQHCDSNQSENKSLAEKMSQLRHLVPPHFFNIEMEKFSKNSLFQMLDDTNPVAELSQKRRLTFRGPGGIPENTLFLSIRDVHPTDFARLCPIETPQGENLGLNLYLAQDTRINNLGLIEAKFIDKEGLPVFLDPYDEDKLPAIIGSRQPGTHKKTVYAKSRDSEITICPTNSISHYIAAPDRFLGYAASLIPFLQHNDANRALMGVNMMKQALPLKKPEAPFIRTGFEKTIHAMCGGTRSQQNVFFHNEELCLGRNLLIGYMPWNLLNYEDGIVISDRLQNNGALTHIGTEEIIVDDMLDAGEICYRKITQDNPHIDFEKIDYLDEIGVIMEGQQVVPGKILVSRITPALMKESQKAGEHKQTVIKLLSAFINKSLLENTRDDSVYAGAHIYGTVKRVEWIAGDLPINVMRRVRIVIKNEIPIQVGDKLTGRHGNKGVVSRILSELEMPFIKAALNDDTCSDALCTVKEPHTHLQMLINPLTITGRMNLGQLYETTLGWIAKHQPETRFTASPFSTEWAWDSILSRLKQLNLRSQEDIFFVRDGKEIQTDRPVTVGYQYFLKLRHLSEKKMRGRSHDAYSPTSGHPAIRSLNDKWAQRNENRKKPQRLGEMEVWALLGHQAWNILDEMLFLKSDSEKLRLNLIDQIQGIERTKKKIWHELKTIATDKKWYLVDKNTVTCPFQDKNEFDHFSRKNGIAIISQNEVFLGVSLLHDSHKLKSNLMKFNSSSFQAGINKTSFELEKTIKGERLPFWKDRTGYWVYWPVADIEPLKERADELCYSIETQKTTSFLIEYNPIQIGEREHRSFKNFIHYCRALGLEIEGMDNENRPIKLIAEPFWPHLKGVSIRLATDAERKRLFKKQTSNNIVSEPYELWSEQVFTDSDTMGFISLTVPVDNPLFRDILEILMDEEGFIVAKIENELKAIIDQYCQSKGINFLKWEGLWKKAEVTQSCLQTIDDLVDWFSGELGCNSEQRVELRAMLEKSLSRHDQFNFKLSLDPKAKESDRYLTIRELYNHFRFMTDHLESIENRIASSIRTAISSEIKRLQKRMDVFQTLRKNGYRPVDFFMKNLIVLPKHLRFEKQYIQDQFITPYQNDLNRLYKSIIIQNRRIEKLYEGKAPSIICRNEEEKLRKRVYSLLMNDKLNDNISKPLYSASGSRKLTSILSCLIGIKTGKDGIFRKYLLGKRVDFSGRVVIVPDPDLGLDEAGLPFEMGKILFFDHLINNIIKADLVPDKEEALDAYGSLIERPLSIKKRLKLSAEYVNNENNRKTILTWLQELAIQNYILLNRAPSLHRLSILSFRPKIIQEKNVIRLNPYVCAPFNADFDGDTMAVYLPLLPKSIIEAERMLPSKILRSPGHGNFVISHKGDLGLAQHLQNLSMPSESIGDLYHFLNEELQKSPEQFPVMLKDKTLSFQDTLCQSGFSLSVDDFILQPDIRELVNDFEIEFQDKEFVYQKERLEYWREKTEWVRTEIERISDGMSKSSALKILRQSKAAKVELNQLSGMRGIMLRPGGNYVDYPVCSNIVDGMTPFEYFVSCHGSRHGLSDKGLMTGPAGDLTNILVQATHNEFIVEADCGTEQGLWISAFSDVHGGYIPLQDRITGRFLVQPIALKNGQIIECESMITPELAELICRNQSEVWIRSTLTCQGIHSDMLNWNEFVENVCGQSIASSIDELGIEMGTRLDEALLLAIARMGIHEIQLSDGQNGGIQKIRLPQVHGVCQKCYGIDLSTGALPPVGYPAGIIASQSIGEPGTQLTLRTFHTGGTAGQEISQGLTTARRAFSLGKMKQPLKSALNGSAKIISTTNGLSWLEVTGTNLSKQKMSQRHLIIYSNPVSEWDGELEKKLNTHELNWQEVRNPDGSITYIAPEIQRECTTVKPETADFPVTIDQRLFFSRQAIDTETVPIKDVCRRYGPLAASEYLLHALQRIYNASSKVADHHFEVVIRVMMKKLKVVGSSSSSFDSGENISLHQYLASSQKPEVKPRSVLQAASGTDGFLNRIAFREAKHHLVRSALNKETDWLVGLKEQIIAGLIRKRPGGDP